MKIFSFLLEFAGWVAAIGFVLALGLAIISCPPWGCSGQGLAIYMLPIISGLFLIPAAALFISWGRVLKSQLKDSQINSNIDSEE